MGFPAIADICMACAGSTVIKVSATPLARGGNQTSPMARTDVNPPSRGRREQPTGDHLYQEGREFIARTKPYAGSDLDLSQVFERPAPEVWEALPEYESRTISVPSEVRVTGRLMEDQNDQIDCSRWLRVIDCNIGASYDACPDSSAGRHDHASRFSVRRR
jgi:hypothetical protein